MHAKCVCHVMYIHICVCGTCLSKILLKWQLPSLSSGISIGCLFCVSSLFGWHWDAVGGFYEEEEDSNGPVESFQAGEVRTSKQVWMGWDSAQIKVFKRLRKSCAAYEQGVHISIFRLGELEGCSYLPSLAFVAGEGRKPCASEEWMWACLQIPSVSFRLGPEMFADALVLEKGVSPAGPKTSAF